MTAEEKKDVVRECLAIINDHIEPGGENCLGDHDCIEEVIRQIKAKFDV